MPLLNAILVAAAIAANAAKAHMILNTPTPYGPPTQAPLDASGSDFPCHGHSSSGAFVTEMQIGSPLVLSFNGTAVHGGGSCQISLTKDNPATKSSKWQVIHSIEGGCPARNQAGNLPEGSGSPNTTPDPDTYKYSIPQGIAPGDYTFAWTWFNKIGNREMYMNCAMVKITGGASKRDIHHPHACNNATHDHEHGEHVYLSEDDAYPRLTDRDTSSFPDMFLANIGNGCTTADSKDLKFPNPGSSVEINDQNALAPPVGSGCGGGSAPAGGSSGGTGAGTGAGAGGGGGGSGAAPGGASGQNAPGGADSGAGSGAGAGAGTGTGTGSSTGSGSGAGAGAGAGSGSGASPSTAAGSSPGASSGSGSGSGSGAGSGTQSSTAPSAAASSGASSSSSGAAAPYANSSSGGSGGSGTAAPSGGASSNTPSSGSGSGSSSSSGTGGASSGASSGAGASSSKGSCTSAGQSVCSPDGRQIGTCASDMTVTWIPVASGTKCSGGLMVMANAPRLKRSARFLTELIG